MKLRGQGNNGYAMAVLLVAMGVMAVVLTAVMPVWKQTSQREKEAELVFRGQQYARAIGLFQKKNGPGTLPGNLDVLVDQRFLRKKYKDPITNGDFVPLTQTPATAPGTGGPTASRPGAAPTSQAGQQTPGAPRTPGAAPATGGALGAQPGGGITGVASKSKDQSIRIYNGRTHYNEWAFVFVPQTQAAGGAPGGPGRSGQPPTGPGGIPSRPGDPNRPNRPPNPTGRESEPGPPGTPERPRGGFGSPSSPLLPGTPTPRRPGL